MDLFNTGRRIGDFLGHLFKIVRGLQQARLLRFDSAGDVGQLLLSVPGHQDTSAGGPPMQSGQGSARWVR